MHQINRRTLLKTAGITAGAVTLGGALSARPTRAAITSYGMGAWNPSTREPTAALDGFLNA